ncbi:MAG TPA: hypothetical protein QGH10_03005, partial [Armatimonadota bacterium]|nr:hypothetical protein [Armatimonadota bacterium]
VEPDEVIIESSGPIRATIRVKGKFANAAGESYMRYTCRMHFYAGQPFVRTVLSIDNDVADPDMNLIGRATLRIPAELAAAQVSCGADGEAVDLAVGSRLLQDEDNRFTAGAAQGEHADGWIMARGGAGSIAVAVRDFWQLYPKAFATDDVGITVELLPELPETYAADASDDDLTKLYYWADAGRYKVRTGVRLTTEFAVDFAPEPAGAEYPRAAAWQEPLFAACTPEWYCDSGAFGPMVPRKAGKFDHYENDLDDAFASFMKRRVDVREYGFMNYGDWFGERTWNWGNIEYDTQWSLASNFARTGNVGMLRAAEEAAWHNADVDTIRYSANPDEIGRVYTHCTGHTGGYFPPEWKDMRGFNSGYRDTGHTWCQGNFTLAMLTGERRYLESARLVADWLTDHTTDFSYYSERNVGWPMIGLAAGYNVTGNPRYLHGAQLMADMAMWTLHPDTDGWGHWIGRSECKHEPQCWGPKPFMTGVLLHGLKMYDLAQPREDIKALMRRNADFMWATTYIPEDAGFYYSGCLKFREKGSSWTIGVLGDGLAYACLIDPDHARRDVLKETTEAFMYGPGVSGFGKNFTMATCFMPLMLNDLEALGLTQFPIREE